MSHEKIEFEFILWYSGMKEKQVEKAYQRWKKWKNKQVELLQYEENKEEFDYLNEPCETCGEIQGMKNPCCSSYDELHFSNCGYG